jgi:hypothetical protein
MNICFFISIDVHYQVLCVWYLKYEIYLSLKLFELILIKLKGIGRLRLIRTPQKSSGVKSHGLGGQSTLDMHTHKSFMQNVMPRNHVTCHGDMIPATE